MKLRYILPFFLAGIIIGLIIMFLAKRQNNDNKIEVTHSMIVKNVEAMGKLEVVKYTIQNVMEYKKTRDWLPSAKTVLIIHGEVVGCIDLTKIKEKDIYTSKDSIRLTLPQPEICQVVIDHTKSHIHNMEFGLWESDKIADEAYELAQKELLEKAKEMNIYSDCRINTEYLLTPLLKAMGFNKVTINFALDDEYDYNQSEIKLE